MEGSNGAIRVLLVDDDQAFVEMTATFLEREGGFETLTATGASEGLDVLAREAIDCVVSDHDMPGTDGIEFLEAIRETHPDLPFILFTGKGSEEVASEAISAGVTDYLRKRTGTDQYALLANRVENVVEGYRTRRALDRRTQRLETLISNLPGIVYRCANEPEWPMEFVEGECEELTGYPAEALESGEVLWGEEILHPEDREEMWEAVQDALDAGEPFEVTYRILTKAGEEKWMWERGRGIYEGGDLDALEGFITDVTARETRKRELRRYESMVDAMKEAACIYDEAGRFVVVNEYLAEWYGKTREALEGEESNLVPHLRRGEGDPYAELLAGERAEIRGEVEADFPGHGEAVLDYRLTPLEVDGEIEGAVGVARDIIERKERERELERQNERLEEFASIVSHDLRNPLNVAEGHLELARAESDSEHLDEVAESHDRMRSLIDDLLTLAREGQTVEETTPVEIREVVEDCWQGVETDEATLVSDFGTDHEIEADPDRLRQILENLVRNAVEHGADRSPGSAEVTVTVGPLEDGFYVADDGPGIPEDEREKVFEAGYSSSSQGSGFGLNIVQQIADAHGWTVEVTDSEPGGARFEITGVEIVDE